MADVTIEALKAGEDTDALIDELGESFEVEQTTPGRWRVEIDDADSEEDAREKVESALEALDDAGDWGERLRLS
jgi:hypothetical protein